MLVEIKVREVMGHAKPRTAACLVSIPSHSHRLSYFRASMGAVGGRVRLGNIRDV